MKKVLILLAVLLALSAGAFASTITYNVSANGTFLEQTVNDSCANTTLAVPGCQSSYFMPTIIAVTPGDTVILTEGGGGCYSGFVAGVPQGCVNEPLAGVFDISSTDLLAYNYQNRLPNQVATALPHVTDPNFNTYYAGNGMYTGQGITTEIPGEFYICGPGTVPDCSSSSTTIVVPTGAHYLYVGALDSFYADNSSNPLGGLTVTVNEFATPEPATWTLLLAGLVLCGTFYRRRRASAIQ